MSVNISIISGIDTFWPTYLKTNCKSGAASKLPLHPWRRDTETLSVWHVPSPAGERPAAGGFTILSLTWNTLGLLNFIQAFPSVHFVLNVHFSTQRYSSFSTFFCHFPAEHEQAETYNLLNISKAHVVNTVEALSRSTTCDTWLELNSFQKQQHGSVWYHCGKLLSFVQLSNVAPLECMNGNDNNPLTRSRVPQRLWESLSSGFPHSLLSLLSFEEQ